MSATTTLTCDWCGDRLEVETRSLDDEPLLDNGWISAYLPDGEEWDEYDFCSRRCASLWFEKEG